VKKTTVNVKTMRLCERCQRTEVKPKKLLILTSESKRTFFCIKKRKKIPGKKKLKKTTLKTFVGKIQVFKKLDD